MREYEHGSHHFDAFIELLHSCRDGAMKPLAELHYQSVFTPQHLPQKRAHHAAPTPKARSSCSANPKSVVFCALPPFMHEYAAFGANAVQIRRLWVVTASRKGAESPQKQHIRTRIPNLLTKGETPLWSVGVSPTVSDRRGVSPSVSRGCGGYRSRSLAESSRCSTSSGSSRSKAARVLMCAMRRMNDVRWMNSSSAVCVAFWLLRR